VQGIGSAVVDVTSGDHFELSARHTSASTKNVPDNELSWFAIEVRRSLPAPRRSLTR
jgi:hypothetical protein